MTVPILRRLQKAIHLFHTNGRHPPKSGIDKDLGYERNALGRMKAYLNTERRTCGNRQQPPRKRSPPQLHRQKETPFFWSAEADSHSAILNKSSIKFMSTTNYWLVWMEPFCRPTKFTFRPHRPRRFFALHHRRQRPSPKP